MFIRVYFMKKFRCSVILCSLLLAASVYAADNYKTLFDAGCQEYAKRNYAVAAAKLEQAQTMAATPSQAYAVNLRLANIYVAQKNFASAIEQARKVLAYEKCGKKESFVYLTLISDSYYRLGKYQQALDTAEEVLKLPVERSLVVFQRVALLLKSQNLIKLRRYKEALTSLQSVEDISKFAVQHQAKYNWLAGCAAEFLGDFKLAISYFQKNLVLDGKWFTDDSKRHIALLTEKLKEASMPAAPNMLPDGSFEYSTGGAWNRLMLASYPYNSYLPADCQWDVDETTAFHGKRSLRSRNGNPLLLQCEGDHDNTVFSIYLKADKHDTPVTVTLYGYSRFQPTKLAEKKFKVTCDWQQYRLNIPRKWLSVDKVAAPQEFYITPPGNATVWADAAQWQKKASAQYQEYAGKTFAKSDALKEFAQRNVFEDKVQEPVKNGKLPAKREFTVKYPCAAENVPVTAGIPFAVGEWFGQGSVSVESAATGKRYPAQGVISARWVKDRSVRMLCVNFSAPLSGKSDKFKLHFSQAPEKAAPAYKAPELSLYVIGGDGKRFNSRELLRKTINSGALFSDEVRQGLLFNDKEEALAMYSLHLRFYHHDNSIKIFSNILNMSLEAAAIREAALIVDTKKSGKPDGYLQHYSHTNKRFLLPPDGSFAQVAANGGALLVREGSLRHPVKLTVDAQGKFTGYLWSGDFKPLMLSRLMNLSREFIYTPDRNRAVQYGYRASAIADVQDVVSTNFLMLPLGVVSEKTHPYAVRNFNELRDKLLMPPENIFADQKKLIHGHFNFGDVYGDRGWSNQESYMDYSAINLALMRQDPAILANGFERAMHYRDVDILDGIASYHSPGHTSGPSYEYSHSWPQGVLMHYLLTGDTRSYEVIKRVITRYMATPVEFKYITDSRSLGRFLLGLSDFYTFTGDPAIRDRFYVQLARAEKENLLPEFKDQTIFHWHGRCDPFHIWYGCFALYQMYQHTGDEKLLQSFKREMDASLNMDFFRHDLNELWYGVPQEKAWPIMLGYQSHHRGSLFYPMMRFYAEKFNRPDYLKIAQLAAYVQFLRGDSYSEPMDIFRTAVLAEADEKTLLEEAIMLRRNAAPGQGKVVNGDFSASTKWFKHWHLPAGRQMSYDDVVESWPLPKVKDMRKIDEEHKKLWTQVSPWRGYARKYAWMDTEEFYNSAPSLKVTSTSDVNLESAPIFIEPGNWKFTGAFKCDENVDLTMTNFTVNYTQEKEKNRAYRFKPFSPDGTAAELNVWHGSPILKDAAVRFIKGKKGSWREFEFVFRNEGPGLITLKSFVRPKAGKTAEMWFDDVKLERMK